MGGDSRAAERANFEEPSGTFRIIGAVPPAGQCVTVFVESLAMRGSRDGPVSKQYSIETAKCSNRQTNQHLSWPALQRLMATTFYN